MRLHKQEASEYGKRSRMSKHRYDVEGEQVTVREMSERLNISYEAAKKRHMRLRADSSVQRITWALMGARDESA